MKRDTKTKSLKTTNTLYPFLDTYYFTSFFLFFFCKKNKNQYNIVIVFFFYKSVYNFFVKKLSRNQEKRELHGNIQ